MQLQYIGFEQVKNKREYIFNGTAHGEPTKAFVVSTDLALFVKHHVGMQEGPALCLHKLTNELGAIDLRRQPSSRYALTDDDMLAFRLGAFLSGQHSPAARGVPKTKKPRPAC
jgi:hypothetical protein